MPQMEYGCSMIILILLMIVKPSALTSNNDEAVTADKMDGFESSPIVYNSNAFIPLKCYNGGTFKNGKCECTERYEGEQCERESCLNGGIKSSDSTCHCPWGTTGSRCEKVTYCVESNGRLEDGKCICADRFSGSFCQLRLCHNGDFVRDGDNKYCHCDKGYTGPFCNEKLVCIHGHITDDNKCYCDANWTGERCDRCAIDHRLIGNECRIVINEQLLIAPQHNSTETLDVWSLVMIVSAIGVVIALIAVISAILFKKRQTKASKIDSSLGTDV